ncbi:hypothetical protein [Methanolobus sp. WCC4]|uniref:hypothetical protein n=1 Tax=Methanolobus sp. WCC4 TaxID=3125784 RepID=UPI0030F9A82B
MLSKNRMVGLQIVVFLMLSLSLSGCVEDDASDLAIADMTENSVTNIQEPEVTTGSSGETIIVPEGIQVSYWKIAVDRILITIENTGDSSVFVNTIGADVSFDDDMSTFRHYEATVNSELGTNEEKMITIRIHQLSDWERPHLLTIDVS